MIEGPTQNNHIVAMEKMVMCISEKIINPGWMTTTFFKTCCVDEAKRNTYNN